MMKVNIKGFGELEFPDGTSPEQMKASINSAIASGKLKPKVEESVEPQKEYTPPELEYNLDAVEIQEKKNQAGTIWILGLCGCYIVNPLVVGSYGCRTNFCGIYIVDNYNVDSKC